MKKEIRIRMFRLIGGKHFNPMDLVTIHACSVAKILLVILLLY